MGNGDDLTQYFEAIVGRELADDLVNDIVTRDLIGIDYRTDAGHRTSREIGTTGDSTKGCSDTGVLTVGGVVVTGEDGVVERLLSEFHCESDRSRRQAVVNVLRPFVLVGTPRSSAPVFVTTRTSRVETNGLGDVRMRFATWNAGGDPVPGVSVAWHCLAAYDVRFVVDD